MPQISKAQMVPGTKLKIRPVIKDGITAISTSSVLPHVRMMEDAGSMMNGHRAINSGDIVTVVEPPKRRTCGINTIIVEDATGVQGHVYWCEMRASADIV